MTDDAATIEQLRAELREAREQQAATAEVLRVIASSSGDRRTVLDAIASAAARLTESDAAVIQQVFDERLFLIGRYAPHVSEIPRDPRANHFSRFGGLPAGRGTIAGRTLLERRTIHVPDVLAAIETEFPDVERAIGQRSQVSTPLLRDDTVLGVLSVQRHVQQRAYSEREVALLETFAN